MASDVREACDFFAKRFATFLRTCEALYSLSPLSLGEDYVGDLFVPKIGLYIKVFGGFKSLFWG